MRTLKADNLTFVIHMKNQYKMSYFKAYKKTKSFFALEKIVLPLWNNCEKNISDFLSRGLRLSGQDKLSRFIGGRRYSFSKNKKEQIDFFLKFSCSFT